MVWAMKLRISTLEDEKTFEKGKGKNKVKSINILEKEGIIQIEFEEGSEWDCKIIPIQSLESIDYNREKPKGPQMRSVEL
jgi:hypothetical protein